MAGTAQTVPFIPAFAAFIAEKFPALEGRALAVSDVELNAENIPKKLPIAVLALQNEDAVWSERSNMAPEITEVIQLSFIMKPERYVRSDGTESPFWSFYNYHQTRNTLVQALMDYRTPQGGRVRYRQMRQAGDQLTTEITFTLTHHFRWCGDETAGRVIEGNGVDCPTIQTCILGAPDLQCCECTDPTSTASDNCP